MKLSNLRIERDADVTRLVCDCSCGFSQSKKLWFSVQPEFSDWLTDDVYDAFFVAALYPAMFYNEDIEIEGNVSKKLYFNIIHYVENIVHSYREYMHYINIHVKGFAKAKKIASRVGTGFSAGVDSFSTVYDHYELEDDPDYKINTFFFFNVGSHGGGGDKARALFNKRYEMLKSFPESVRIPYVKMDSNLFESIYQNKWEFDAGVLLRITAILVFQRVIRRYYLSNAHAYSVMMNTKIDRLQSDMSSLVDPYINPLLSPDECDIICDGAQYTRSEKTERICNYKPVYKYLNVCVNMWGDYSSVKNCSCCSKCLRTLAALDSLGVLEKFGSVFDLEKYAQNKGEYDYWLVYHYDDDAYARDNVDLAKKHGRKMPTIEEARKYYRQQKMQKRLNTLRHDPLYCVKRIIGMLLRRGK